MAFTIKPINKTTSSTSASSSNYDITSKEGLQSYANQLGLGNEVEKIIKKDSKMSFLNKLTTGLSAFETGNATYQSMVNNKNWFKTYFSDIGTGLYEAFSGNDVTPEIKKTFKNVLTDEYNMKDRSGKIDLVDIAGLAGDILLDPTTYIPAGTLKKGMKKVSNLGESAIRSTTLGDTILTGIDKGFLDSFKTLADFKRYDKLNGTKLFDTAINLKRADTAAENAILSQGSKIYNKTYSKLVKSGLGKDEALDLLKSTAKETTYKVQKGLDVTKTLSVIEDATDADSLYKTISELGSKLETEALEKGILKNKVPNYVMAMLTPDAQEYTKFNNGILAPYLRALDYNKPLKSGGLMKVVSTNEVMKKYGVTNIADLTKSQLDEAKNIDNFGSIFNLNKRKDLHYINHEKMNTKIEVNAQKQMAEIEIGLRKAYKNVASKDEGLKYLKGIKAKLQKTKTLSDDVTKVIDDVLPDVTDKELVDAFTRGYVDKLITKEELAIEKLTKEGVTKTVQKTTKASTKLVNDRALELLKEAGETNVKKNISKYRKIAREEFETKQARSIIETSEQARIKIQNQITEDINQISKYDMVDDYGNLFVTNNATHKEVNNMTRNSEEFGFDLFNEDYFEAMTAANVSKTHQINRFNYLQGAKKEIGISKEGLTNLAGSKVYQAKDGIKYLDVSDALPELKGLVVPADIAENVIEAAEMFSGKGSEQMSDMLQLYDKVMRVFKGSVTGWFPAFHSRNAISGVFNNYLAGVKNPVRYEQATDIFFLKKDGALTLKDGTEMTYQAIRDYGQQYLIDSSSGMIDVSTKIDPFKIKTGKDAIKKLPQTAMNGIETELRGTLFIDSLVKGDSVTDAVKKVYKYHFDYEPWGLSKFEQTKLKRVIPFYTFMRNNVPLQIEELLTQPAKYSGIMKTERALQGDITAEDRDNMNEYMQNQFLIKSGNNIISGLGLPLEEAMNQLQHPLSAIAGSMSPLIKIPLEQVTGYNFYKQMPIEDDSYGKKYSKAPELLKKILDFEDITYGDDQHFYTVDPIRKYVVDTLGMRGLTTGLSFLNTIDPNSSGAQNVFNIAQDVLTTIQDTDLSIEDLTKYADEDVEEEIEAYLSRKGTLNEFSSTYIPETQREQLGVTSTGSIPK